MRLRSSRRIVFDVLTTLLIREWRHRVSRGRLSMAWLLIEPLVQMVFIGWLYAAFGRQTVAGQDASLFLGTGIFAFLTFRSLCIKPSDAIISGAGLLNYRQVHVLDLILGKWLFEAGAYLVLIALALGWLALAEPSFHLQPLEFLFCLGVILSSSLGISCILATLRRKVPASAAFFKPVSYGLYIFSGVLHPVWQLQEWLADLLMYNPLVPLLERVRQSLLFAYTPGVPEATATLLLFALLPLALGLVLVLDNADQLRTR